MEEALQTQLLTSTGPQATLPCAKLIYIQVQQIPRASDKPLESYAPLC